MVDPSPQADATRGSVIDALVESIDLAPTFLAWCGGAAQPHRLEGLALQPLLHGEKPAGWRRYAISEYDYSVLPASSALGLRPMDARLFMVTDGRWKLIHAEGFRPMLYDMERDPEEFHDLGGETAFESERQRLTEALNRWARRQSQRTRDQRRADPRAPRRQVAAHRHPDRFLGRSRTAGRTAAGEVARRAAIRLNVPPGGQ